MGVEILKTISLENVKGILWDLDNTIYSYEPVHNYCMDLCKEYAKVNYNIDYDDFETHYTAARKIVHEHLFGQGSSHSRLLYFQKVHELLFGYTNAEFTLKMESCYWDNFLDKMEWIPEIKIFIESARKQKLKMCIVTDLTAQIQLHKWNKLNLGKYMDFLVSSEEAGMEKPERGIFELALSKLNLKSEEVIMIGDSFDKDIKGAHNIGIKAYLIENV